MTRWKGWALIGAMLVACVAGSSAEQPRGQPWQPRPLGPEPPLMGDALVDAANGDLAQRDIDSARQRAQYALTIQPESAAARTVLGLADWMDGRITSSNRELRQALHHERLYFGAGVALARNLRASGELTESRRLLAALATDDPQQDLPLIGLLDTAWVEGDFDALCVVAKELLPRLSPDTTVYENAKVLAKIGGVLEGTGPWLSVSGTRGSVPLLWGRDLPLGKVAAQADGAPVRVSTNWGSTIPGVTTEWLEGRSITAQGSVKWIDGTQAQIVLIPRIDFGEIALERIPAIVLPKGSWLNRSGADVVLGRHGLTAFGSIRIDATEASAEFSQAPPATPGEDAIVAPLFFLSADVGFFSLTNTLATMLQVTPTGPEIAVYLGAYPDPLVLVDWAPAGNRAGAAAAEQPKFLPIYLGGRDVGLTDVIVLDAGTEEITIELVRDQTSLEPRGSLNPSALEGWVVTYAPASARLILEPTPAE